MREGLTVVIPVGPSEANRRWLPDALKSVREQTRPADEILIISDMAPILRGISGCRIWHTPWRLGIAAAFNCGVALAKYECVFMMGSDDWLEPDCLEKCMEVYEEEGKPGNVFFFVGVRYDDEREEKEQYTPCNAAMVTKRLWRATGGFPPQCSSGAMDAAFCSIFWNRPEICRFLGVEYEKKTLYNYRVHLESETAYLGPWQGVILETRDLLTSLWKPPEWAEQKVLV